MKAILKFLGNFTLETLETLSIVSYEILLVTGLIGLVLSLFGWEKGKRIGTMSPAVYIILRIIVKVMCNA